jgi:hypothetical protein
MLPDGVDLRGAKCVLGMNGNRGTVPIAGSFDSRLTAVSGKILHLERRKHYKDRSSNLRLLQFLRVQQVALRRLALRLQSFTLSPRFRLDRRIPPGGRDQRFATMAIGSRSQSFGQAVCSVPLCKHFLESGDGSSIAERVPPL